MICQAVNCSCNRAETVAAQTSLQATPAGPQGLPACGTTSGTIIWTTGPPPPLQKHVHAVAIDSYTGAFLPCCAVADTVAGWNAPQYGSHNLSV